MQDEVFSIVPEEIDAAFAENEETLERVEIRPLEEIADLPEGIGFSCAEGTVRGVDAVADELRDILQTYDLASGYALELAQEAGTSTDREIIGAVFTNLPHYATSTKAVKDLLQKHPNICWMRGAGYAESSDGIPTMDANPILGADGYIGDMSALAYAESDYKDNPRDKPTLYVAPVFTLLEGTESGAITLGSKHGYDVSICVKDAEKFADWMENNMLVYSLGDSPESLGKAEELLFEKSL